MTVCGVKKVINLSCYVLHMEMLMMINIRVAKGYIQGLFVSYTCIEMGYLKYVLFSPITHRHAANTRIHL